MNSWVQNKVLASVNKVAGVTVRLLDKGTLSIQILVVEKRKGKLSVTDRKQGIDSYDELKKAIPKGCPVLVNIEGAGILIKAVNFNPDGFPKEQIVNEPDKFKFHTYNKSGTGYISVLRKDLYDNIVSELDNRKINIVCAKADPFITENLFSLLPLKGEHLFGNWRVNIADERMIGIKATMGDLTENYKIGDDIIQSIYLLSYSDCIDFFTNNYDPGKENIAYLSEFTYKKLIEFVGWGILVLLFVGLTVNFFVNDTYRTNFERVSGEYGKNKSVLQKLNLATAELDKKENLIVNGGLTGSSDLAWYADRTVSLMPSQLVLKKMEINPLEKKLQEGKEIVIKNGIISIGGESQETIYINNWIKTLKQEKWIKDVEMTYYARKQADSPASFNLDILMYVE